MHPTDGSPEDAAELPALMVAPRTYKLVLEYDGTDYMGFQRQTPRVFCRPSVAAGGSPPATRKSRLPRSPQSADRPTTVQEALERACLRVVTGIENPRDLAAAEPLRDGIVGMLRVRSCGRTDAGVHAAGMVAAIDYDRAGSEAQRRAHGRGDHVRPCPFDSPAPGAARAIRRALNSRLPADICVLRMEELPRSVAPFEPRRCVARKRYVYRVRYLRYLRETTNGGGAEGDAGTHCFRSSLDRRYIWDVPWQLCDVGMVAACRRLAGRHDFASFVHKEAGWKEQKRRRDGNRDDGGGDAVYTKKMDLHGFYLQVDSERPLHDAGSPPVTVVTARFVAEAQGFARSMVRNLVGFVVDIGRGKRKLEDADVALLEGDRVTAGVGSGNGNISHKLGDTRGDLERAAALVCSAPACGLCLEKVWLDGEELEN